MARYEIQMIMNPTSNVGADSSTNTWSVEAATPADALLFVNNLITFYRALTGLYSGLTNQIGHRYKIYDRADPKPRAPKLEGAWSFTQVPTGNALPPEVAIVLSFQGLRLSGTNQARRRGRVYLGPVASANNTADGRPTTATTTLIGNTAAALLAASDAAPTWLWTVHSGLLPQDTEITDGWVDNEWDTQRRRGRKPTIRTTYT